MSGAGKPGGEGIVANSRGWMACGSGLVGLVFGPTSILVLTFGVFVAPIQREFGWSRPAILFAATIVSLTIMFVSPIQGYLIDRFGTRRVVLVSMIPFAAGLAALSAIGSDIRLFYLAYAVLPLLAIGLWPVSYLRVVSTWFDRRLGLAVGITNGGIGLGAAVLPLLITYVMSFGTWRTAYLVLAAIVVAVTLPLNLWRLGESPDDHRARARKMRGADGGEATEGLTFPEILRSRSFAVLLAAYFLLGIVNNGLVMNHIPMLIDFGASPARAAAVHSAFGVSVLVGRFLTGVLLDYVVPKRLMTVACMGGAVGCMIYATAIADNRVFVSAILFGAVVGAEFDVLSYLVKRYFGLLAFGRAYGSVYALFQFGGALGASLLPLSRNYLGTYTMGLQSFAVILALSGLLFTRLGPYMFATGARSAVAESTP